MKPYVIALAIAIGAFRPVLIFVDFNPHIEASYQAMAHLLVGGLLGAHLGYRKHERFGEPLWSVDYDWLIVTFWALTAVEVICAGITIFQKHFA